MNRGRVRVAGAALICAGLTLAVGALTPAQAAPRQGQARPKVLVAVRAGRTPADPGALVVLNPVNGRVVRTLDRGGAVGGALTLTPNGARVYYEKTTGCRSEIWTVSVAGGRPKRVAIGARPALSNDGTRLAYATGHYYGWDGERNCPSLYGQRGVASYAVVTRVLATGAERRYPIGPGEVLPAPVGHLSWNTGGTRLAVSLDSSQDNEGWDLRILNPARDRYYVGSTAAGRSVPVVGPGTTAKPKDRVFFREGVYLPSGELFVVRRCCSGWDPVTTSELLQRVDPRGGAVRAQIAVGSLKKDHTSLDSDRSGHWLLFLSDTTVMVSKDGARPTMLTTGYQAVAW